VPKHRAGDIGLLCSDIKEQIGKVDLCVTGDRANSSLTFVLMLSTLSMQTLLCLELSGSCTGSRRRYRVVAEKFRAKEKGAPAQED